MGIKGDKKATSDQARLARLTLEGNSGNEEDIQLMIKTIIETTGCTQSQAEIALLDSDNSLYGAINHILESGDNLDTWTEQKGAKKEKKKPDESSFNNRGFVARGRGGGTGFSDRGGRGRSNGAPRENRDNRDSRDNRENREPREQRDREQGKEFGGAPRFNRGGFEKPYVGRGGRGGGRGGYSRAVAPSSTIEPDAFNNDLDENLTKVDTNVNEVQPPVEESVTATVPTSSAPAPISFAAVAAAAHRKEELRKQQLHNPQPSAPPRRSLSPAPPLVAAPAPEEPAQPAFSEPETSNQQEKDDSFFPSDSSALAEEQIPNVSTHIDENVQSSPEQTNQAWTTQLKTDLGIGLNEAPGLGLSPIPSSHVKAPVIPDPGVEFVGTAPMNAHDYSFGFVEAPPSPQIPSAETSAASISTNQSENIFNSPRMMQKQTEPERSIPNGDYGLKTASPPLGYGQTNRGLSYDTSSSSYPPTDRLASNKSQFNNPGQLQSQQSTQQQPQQQQQPQPTQQQQTPPAQQQQQQQQAGHPQHPQQHMLFTPQLTPYGPYMNSYMNMYSPMPGVRDEQYAALMQYGMGVDLAGLSTILPQSAALSQSVSSQQASGQQRDPAHSLMDFQKFNQQNQRDQQQQQQQPSNVGPPPGFQSTNYLQQPNLSSLFMQQPYPAAPHAAFGFMNMMPSVGNNSQGRQMYGQEDERKGYDKMAQKPTAQQNQHSQYQHNGGNIGKYGNMNNKPYNWGN